MIEQRVDHVNSLYGGTLVTMRRRESDILLTFPGATEGGYEEYLAAKYDTSPHACLGQVVCHDHAEASFFMDLLEGRVIERPGEFLFDADAINEATKLVYAEGLKQAVQSHGDEGGESLPYTGGCPSWLYGWAEVNHLYNADLLYTAGWSSVGAHFSDIVQPSGEDESSLLLFINNDTGSESHVDLGSGEEFERSWGIEEGSLEWFLWCQTFCHNTNLSKGNPSTALIRYDVMGAVWLRPTPDNLQYLEFCLSRDDCRRYHDWRDDGLASVVPRWLEAVKGKIEEDDEWNLELFVELEEKYGRATA